MTAEVARRSRPGSDRPRLPFGPTLALLLAACIGADEPAQPAGRDVGAASLELQREDLGIRFLLPTPEWREVEAPTPPIVLEARRASDAPVPPRVAVTREVAGSEPAETVFARVLADLKGIGERPGVTLVHTGFALRSVGGAEGAEIRLSYRADSSGLRVRQRSLLILPPQPAPAGKRIPPGPDGRRGAERAPPSDRALVSLTATWLEADTVVVEPEVERAFERVDVLLPEPPSRDEP